MPDVCVLCLVAALAAFARLAGTVGPVVRCEPCDAGALLQCKPLPKDCVERVKEPGCGCCMTCALGEGQPCGVYTARCGSGLTCRHQPGESRPLQALLEGRGVCSSPASKKLNSVLMPPQKEENAGNQVEDSVNVTQTITVLPGVGTVKDGHSRGSMDTRAPLHNILIQKDENRKTQSYKVESLSGGTNMDVHNFSVENKRENEYGPCRREMESILNSLKISNVLNPRGFRIPNCDRKGFYKKKQCRPSKGRRRGYCWCVDKYGQPLPGYDGRQWGEKQCYNLERK
ncbi:insulin-like growth factor-binding protein 3 isoform X2 [Oreochromis niloticus]|uniref:Insulin-like growth factor-binding protein 3 n=1 Tax=Oreochromis niloticus TaxID=8128 RepID=I3JGM8_ORENI|nr:insulin-like growth factor-binding protein 3 isoform X2 [Oreochromis niloticus]XP_031588439.1 insulin-like growth factor-binding protein 3 isoform X2 [Oreochromis aureus]